MAEENEEVESKPEPNISDKKSDIKPDEKNNEKKPFDFNKFALIAIVVVIALATIFTVVYVSNKSDNNDATTQEELTFAEEQEQYHLVSTASDETKNMVAMSNAWAYYYEDNYSRALEILNTVVNPDDDTRSSQNSLYGLIYEAQGDTERAQEYYVLILNEREKQLLENIKTNPDSPEFNYELANLYYKVGENEKAIEHYKAYVEAVDAPIGTMEEYEYETLQNAKQVLEELEG